MFFFALLSLFIALDGTQDAVANGDTRTLDLYHTHTKESLRITFRRDGAYDSSALEKLNWFLRDWRMDEPTTMAPELFDIVWYSAREAGASEPVRVVSAYRSPGTNAMLARRSRAVAKNSQHMRGNAMDFTIPGISMAKVREIAMRLQRGGVGYYPSAGTPFVHLDVGSVRSWPRMPRDALERLFPDGKTVHIPADGVPLANYEAALAEVQSRGGSALDFATVTTNRGKSLWALLFGGGEEDEDTEASKPAPRAVASRNAPPKGVSEAFDPSATLNDNPMRVSSYAPRMTSNTPGGAVGTLGGLLATTGTAAAPNSASPVSRFEAVDAPLPPSRPKGQEFQAMLATLAPLPPIRPASLVLPQGVALPSNLTSASNLTFAQSQNASAALISQGSADAPIKAVVGMPTPPSRLALLVPKPQTSVAHTSPSMPAPVALPEIMAMKILPQTENRAQEGGQSMAVRLPESELDRKALAVAALRAAQEKGAVFKAHSALIPSGVMGENAKAPTAFLGFSMQPQ